MVTIKCPICEKLFSTYPYYVKRGKKCCSRKCWGISQIGRKIWNKGLKGIHLSPQSEWKQGETPIGSILFKKGQIAHNKGKGAPNAKEIQLLHKKLYKHRVRGAGELTPKTIQLVYEDNIKRYGTLTCYLCIEPIIFGADNLEHKQPLSRGGTNEYNNLAVSCHRCNCKKNNKTLEEYLKHEENIRRGIIEKRQRK